MFQRHSEGTEPAEPAGGGGGGGVAGAAEVAMPAEPADAAEAVAPAEGACLLREVLDLVGDKWSVQVLIALGPGPRRFTELERAVEGVSRRMLTVTLRGLERNGLVTRTVYPVVPPRVEYACTAMTRELREPLAALAAWATRHRGAIAAARRAHDAKPRERGMGVVAEAGIRRS